MCVHQPGEPRPGSGNPHLERALRAAGDPRGLGVAQAVPRDEQHGFALKVGQLAEGADQRRPFDHALISPARGRSQPFDAGQRVQQPTLASITSPAIRDDIAGRDQQPRQRVGRQIALFAPRDHEGVGNDVLCRGAVAMPSRIGKHARGQLVEHRREPVRIRRHNL